MSTEVEVDESVLHGFLEESAESLDGLNALFVQLEKDPTDKELINAIFRPIHSIKGNAPFFGLLKLKSLAHEFESLLAKMRAGEVLAGRETFDLLLAGVDELKDILSRIAIGKPEVIDHEKFDKLLSGARQAVTIGSAGKEPHWDRVGAFLTSMAEWNLDSEKKEVVKALMTELGPFIGRSVNSLTVSVPTDENNPRPVASDVDEVSSASAKKAEPAKTMRVAEERIDTFLEFVGELVTAQDMLRHFSARFEEDCTDPNLSRDLGLVIDVIATLGHGLEQAIMSIRRVPAKTLLQKLPRTVRDIAKLKGKKIEVCILGDDIEIDKSMLELLDAPLMHMARNAADHGIEMPEQRILSGKNEKGTITVSCEELEKEIILTVRDDGAGLNYEALQKKAESLQMIEVGKTLTQAQVVNLLFMAGVSTATEVSDISGRGVGMDVVKKNIEAAGGTIAVHSEASIGSSFSIRVPKGVTTQILQGFVLAVDEARYVLPLLCVHECWVLEVPELIPVVGEGFCTERYGQVLRVIDLAQVFGCSSRNTGNQRLAVTVEVEHQQIVFLVDDVIGARQLVLKSLDGWVNRSHLFLGGAILGDGGVALICDIQRVIAASPREPAGYSYLSQ